MWVVLGFFRSWCHCANSSSVLRHLGWAEGPASLTKNHAPCLVLVHFAASTYTDESILRIHSHLQCSRVKEFFTLYDMSPRIMGLLRPLLQLFWQDKHSTLLSNPFACGCIHLLRIDADAYNYGYKFRVFQVYSICLKQTRWNQMWVVLGFFRSWCHCANSSSVLRHLGWAEGPASLTKNHAPCLVLVHFAASTYTDESILRIHSHFQCSRVKEFISLYDMSPRIMGLLRPLLQLLLTGQAFVPLLPNSEFLRFIVSVWNKPWWNPMVGR